MRGNDVKTNLVVAFCSEIFGQLAALLNPIFYVDYRVTQANLKIVYTFYAVHSIPILTICISPHRFQKLEKVFLIAF